MMTIATWEGRQLRRKNGHKNDGWHGPSLEFPSWLTASGLSARRRIAQPSMQGSLCGGGWYSGEPRDISEFVGIENLPMGTTAAT